MVPEIRGLRNINSRGSCRKYIIVKGRLLPNGTGVGGGDSSRNSFSKRSILVTVDTGFFVSESVNTLIASKITYWLIS